MVDPLVWQPPWAEAVAKAKFDQEVKRSRNKAVTSAVAHSQPRYLIRGIGDRALCLASIVCLTSKVVCRLSACNKKFRGLIKRNRQLLLDGYLLEGYICLLEITIQDGGSPHQSFGEVHD